MKTNSHYFRLIHFLKDNPHFRNPKLISELFDLSESYILEVFKDSGIEPSDLVMKVVKPKVPKLKNGYKRKKPQEAPVIVLQRPPARYTNSGSPYGIADAYWEEERLRAKS